MNCCQIAYEGPWSDTSTISSHIKYNPFQQIFKARGPLVFYLPLVNFHCLVQALTAEHSKGQPKVPLPMVGHAGTSPIKGIIRDGGGVVGGGVL